MLVWHRVHAWNWVVWLWKDGALGAALNVEFVWHWVSLNQVGAALYDSGVHFRSSVAFHKYDDGWRVVEQNAPPNQSLDEALRNAQPTAQ